MTAPAVAAPARQSGAIIVPLLFGSVLNPANSTIMAVAVVPIAAALGASVAQSAWLVSAFYLASAVAVPIVGRLVDLYGARTVFLATDIGSSVAGRAGRNEKSDARALRHQSTVPWKPSASMLTFRLTGTTEATGSTTTNTPSLCRHQHDRQQQTAPNLRSPW